MGKPDAYSPATFSGRARKSRIEAPSEAPSRSMSADPCAARARVLTRWARACAQSIPSCTGCCELLRDMQQHRDAAEQARVQLAGAERELGRQQSEHLARTAELIRAN